MNKVIDQKATKKRIKELRIQNGYTQEQLAKMMSGSRSYYNSMETGDRELTDKYLKSLSIIYDIDVEEIVIYKKLEYENITEIMSFINSFRPTNYYFLRNGNLIEDLKDLDKHLRNQTTTEYKVVDLLLNHLSYEVSFIDIKKHTELWCEEKNLSSIKIKQLTLSLENYFGNYNIAVLIKNKNDIEDTLLLSVDKYADFEKFLHYSLLGNLNSFKKSYSYCYKDNQDFFNKIIKDEQNKKNVSDDSNACEFTDFIKEILDRLNALYSD